jgi:hypothetical protein
MCDFTLRVPSRSTSFVEMTLAGKVRALVESDFAFLCRDNPEYASQAGQHEYDAQLQVARRSSRLPFCRTMDAMIRV